MDTLIDASVREILRYKVRLPNLSGIVIALFACILFTSCDQTSSLNPQKEVSLNTIVGTDSAVGYNDLRIDEIISTFSFDCDSMPSMDSVFIWNGDSIFVG